MKLIKKDQKNSYVKVKVLSTDDLWYLSKLIEKGDIVGAITTRKISFNEKEGERKKIWVKVDVEKVEFQEFSERLKILGKIVESNNELVPNGTYQSIVVGINDELDIYKKEWSLSFKEFLERAVKSNEANILLVAADYGDATFYIYHNYGIESIGRLSDELGGKREIKSYEKNKNQFLTNLGSKIKSIVKTRNVKAVVFGGVGTLTKDFENFIKNDEIKKITRFVKINYSGKNGIKEIINNNDIDSIISETMLRKGIDILNKIMEKIAKEGSVAYGYKEVDEYLDMGGVETLLISENMIKKEREKSEELIRKAELTKAKVVIMPSNNEYGEQLDNIGGVGALLRFKKRF